MIKETIENCTIEFSHSEISSMVDNTLIEGAELRKNQFLQEIDLKDLAYRCDSPQIRTEQNLEKSQRAIQKFERSSVEVPIFERKDDEFTLNQSVQRGRIYSRQKGGKDSISQLSPSPLGGQIFQGQEGTNNLIQQNLKRSSVSSQRQRRVSLLNSHSNNALSGLNSNAQKSTFKKIKTSASLGRFQQIMTIKAMVQKIMRHVGSAKYAKLMPSHFNVIGDNALVLRDQHGFNSIVKLLPTLKPNQILFDLWKIFQILLVGFHLFRVLLILGFPNDNLQLESSIRIGSITFFIIDFVFGLNAGYYQGLTIVTDRIKILEKNSVEIISAALSVFALIYPNQVYLNLVFVIRLRALFQNISIIEQNFSLYQKFPVLLTISKLLLLIILIAHAFACGFVFITQFEENDSIYWIKKQGLFLESWEKIYLTALYFSFITMITVGYGDVAPITDLERTYVIFFTLITCIVYAYVVNTIGSLFSEFALKSAEFKKQKFQIMSYLNDRKISKPLEISVMKYLEYTQQQAKVLKYSKVGEQFLSSIPTSLRKEVCEDYYGRILNEVSIFKKNFTKGCLSSLSQIMKEVTLGPEEFIVTQGDIEFRFFFIVSGKVELILNLNDQQNSSHSLGFLDQGQSFGEKSLFCEQAWALSVRCLENTSIIYMKKNEFINVIKEFRNDYEIYCMLRDQAYSDLEILNLKCPSCQYKNHEIDSCELLLYKPRKSFLISKYNYYQIQEIRNNSFIRRGFKFTHSWKGNTIVRRQLKKLRVSVLNREFNDIVGKINKKNESVFDYIFDDRPELDEKFFEYVPQFYYQDDQIVMALEEEDFDQSQNEKECSFQDSINMEFDEILKDYNCNSALNFKLPTFKSKEINSQDLNTADGINQKSQQQVQSIQEDTTDKKQDTYAEQGGSNTPHQATIINQNITNNQTFSNIQTTINSNISNNLPNMNRVNSNSFIAALNPQSQQSNNMNSNLGTQNISTISFNTNFNNEKPNHLNLVSNLPINHIPYEKSIPPPLSCTYHNSISINSPFFFAPGESGFPSPHQEYQPQGSPKPPILFKNFSRGQMNKKTMIEQNQFYDERSFSASLTPSRYPKGQLGFFPTCTGTVTNISLDNQNQGLSMSAIQPQNCLQEQGIKQSQLLLDKQYQNSFCQNNLSDNDEKDDQRSKIHFLRRGGMHRASNKSNKGHQRISETPSNESEKSVGKRRSMRKVTCIKDSTKLSISNKEKLNNIQKGFVSSHNYHHQSTKTLTDYMETETKSNNNQYYQQFLMKDIFVLMHFDLIKEYIFYFPRFNYSALKFKNKGESSAQHIGKVQHQNLILKKNIPTLQQ